MSDTTTDATRELDQQRPPESGAGELAEKKEPKRGPLLDLPSQEAAKLATELWTKQDRRMRPRIERWKANKLRRRGVIGVSLRRSGGDELDKQELQVHIPANAGRIPPAMNKLARLARRLKANMFVDPPMPDPAPPSDEDTDRDAAEFASRVLQDKGSATGINVLARCRRAFDVASTYGSGFVYVYEKPQATSRPTQIKAGVGASSIEDAEDHPDPDDPTGERRLPWPEYITRYVALDGSLTDDPAQAKPQWVNSLAAQVLTGQHVRFLPEGVTEGIDEADGVMIGTMIPLGTLRKLYPEQIATLRKGKKLEEILDFRPQHAKELLPSHMRHAGADASGKGAKDETHVFCLTIYYTAGGSYPKGCFAVFLGGKERIVESEWIDETDPADPRPLDIPLAQFRQFEEGEDDPYGVAFCELLAGGNEMRASQIASWLEHLERFNKRKVFYPMEAPYLAKSNQAPMGTYIPYSAASGLPKTEEVPAFPQDAVQMYELAGAEMNDESGLQEMGQAMQMPSVTSGFHAATIIEQVKTNLSDVKQHTDEAIERLWRIVLQQVRARFDTARRLKWVGDDGSHKEKAFVGADLGSTRDVRIMRGSFTMMSPVNKAQAAQHWSAGGMIDPYQLKRVISGQIGPLVGAQDDPHLQRIRRQIDAWLEGPPAPPTDEELAGIAGGADVAPEQLEQLRTMEHQRRCDQHAAGIFDMRPNDAEPMVAIVRAAELSRTMSSTRYGKFPPEWRVPFDMAYQHATMSAMPPVPIDPATGQPAGDPTAGSPAGPAIAGADQGTPPGPGRAAQKPQAALSAA